MNLFYNKFNQRIPEIDVIENYAPSLKLRYFWEGEVADNLTLLVERRLTISALLVRLISSALGIPTQRLLINTSAKGGIEPCLEPLVSKEAAHSLDINQSINK